MKNGINHITKLEFLLVIKAAIEATFTSSNIKGGFRGTGLVPLDPEVLISKLDIRLRTPTPLPMDQTSWEPKMPSVGSTGSVNAYHDWVWFVRTVRSWCW